MRVGGGQAADAVAAVVAGAGVGGVGDAGGGAVVCGRARGGGWSEGVLALRGSGPNVQWGEGDGDGLPAGLWRVQRPRMSPRVRALVGG